MLRTIRALASAFVAAASLAAPLFAAAPVFSNNFTAVTLDGVRLGTDTDPSNFSEFPSVVYDPSSALFHMWVANTSVLSIEGLRHATSSDGVHFISDGNLSFAGGSPFPAYGANTEPQFEFPRAAKIGSDWKLLIWTENNPSGAYGDYNYNESVNDIGVDPSTLAVAHQGPVFPTDGSGTFGQTTGPYGIVNGKLYVEDDRIGGLSKWEYNDAAPPSVTPPADVYQDLITGTGYVYFLTNPGNPLGVYVHNVARVLDQGDGTLGVYYSLRYPDGSRVNKQIYYSQSGDDGQTWSAPAGLFSNGDAVRVDGAPNTFDFSHPEVTLVGTRRVLYFSTKVADGAFVVATSAAQPPQANSWADLLGSGQGAGEAGIAAIRTSDGGYAVLAQTHGFFPDNPAFWLVRLDASGEVVSQQAYTAPSTGPGAGSNFFAAALTDAGDGGFVMAGYTVATDSTIWMVRVNASGNVVWSKTYLTCQSGCGDQVASLIRTSDGGFAFALSLGLPGPRLALGKIDGTGTLQWLYSYPITAEFSSASSLIETPDVGLATGASFIPGFGLDNFRVLKTDAAGTTVWDARVGSGNEGKLTAIANFSSDGFLVAGTDPAGFTQVAALDSTGNVLWQSAYTGSGFGAPTALVVTPDGGAGIAGFGSSNPKRATLLQIDSIGAVEWAKTFAPQTSSKTSFSAIVSTFDGGLVAVGSDASPSASLSRELVVKVDAGGGFVGCLDVESSLPIAVSTPALFTQPIASIMVDEIPNTTVADVPATKNTTDAPERIICRGYLPSDLDPTALAADPSGNGVADPGESFIVAPTWENDGLVATSLSGHSSLLSDSNGLDTAEPDPDAGYGTVPSLATSDCLTSTGDCFQFQFQNIPRPSQHWDTTFDETLSTSDPHHRWAKRWTVHAGLSFADVSSTSTFYPFVENIFHNGITGGCGAGVFCPTNPVTRAQMSVFLLKAKHGASYVPPLCTPGVFADVPCPSLFADWIEELAAETITAGCGGDDFCPDDAVTRQQMAVFLLKALIGSGYTPPACTGIFGDVACPSQFADWVETLYNRGITAGCSTSPLLYCPAAPNVREQMAVFLTKTFSLLLYAP
jgi:hypothetical protein